jgi:hypothetical protein
MKNLSKVRGMGRLVKVGVVLGGLGVAGVMAAGPSFAAQAPVNGSVQNGSNSAIAVTKGTQVTQYRAAYTDSVFGPVSCVGVNQLKNGTMQESFTCTSTSGSPLTNVSPGGTVTWGPNMWLSDYNHTSLDKTFSATVSADGMSYTAVATY